MTRNNATERGTIVFLHNEVCNYNTPAFSILATEYNYNVVVIHKETNTQFPYCPPKMHGVTFIPRSQFMTHSQLTAYVLSMQPLLVRVAGWHNRLYLAACKALKQQGVPIVMAFDTQLKGSYRQRFRGMLGSWMLRRCCDKVMVAGPYQFEFAKFLGFPNHNILFNNLCADIETYSTRTAVAGHNKSFLFVGRLHPNKGIDKLVDVWESLEQRDGWTLDIVGDGPLRRDIQSRGNMHCHGYLASHEIASRMHASAFLVLPSVHEPWGLVVHEAASAGLSVICSDVVGSRTMFVIEGYNGYTFPVRNWSALKAVLERAMQLDDNSILKMKANSRQLAHRITPEISAASLVSAIRNV